jgi:hypothetical protein
MLRSKNQREVTEAIVNGEDVEVRLSRGKGRSGRTGPKYHTHPLYLSRLLSLPLCRIPSAGTLSRPHLGSRIVRLMLLRGLTSLICPAAPHITLDSQLLVRLGRGLRRWTPPASAADVRVGLGDPYKTGSVVVAHVKGILPDGASPQNRYLS